LAGPVAEKLLKRVFRDRGHGGEKSTLTGVDSPTTCDKRGPHQGGGEPDRSGEGGGRKEESHVLGNPESKEKKKKTHRKMFADLGGVVGGGVDTWIQLEGGRKQLPKEINRAKSRGKKSL